MTEIATFEILDAATDPRAYRAALLALLGAGDPLDVIVRTTGRIRELVAGRDPSDLARRPAPDEWSAAEIIGHLCDTEVAAGFRWRMILTAERPSYPGYDEKAWAELPKPPLDQLWPVLDGLRTYNHWLLRSIPRAAWSRVGLHSEAGPETLEATLRAYVGHDLAHLNQIERALT